MMLKIKTPLQKAVNRFYCLIQNWDMKYNNDGLIEEIIFEKKELKIVFQEDLREHITNFFLLHPKQLLIKICYRQCYINNENLVTDNLLKDIAALGYENNRENEEISIYFNFLTLNKLLE